MNKENKREHPEIKDLKNICNITPEAKSTKKICRVLKDDKKIKTNNKK